MCVSYICLWVWEWDNECLMAGVCVCLCVCERERETEKPSSHVTNEHMQQQWTLTLKLEKEYNNFCKIRWHFEVQSNTEVYLSFLSIYINPDKLVI